MSFRELDKCKSESDAVIFDLIQLEPNGPDGTEDPTKVQKYQDSLKDLASCFNEARNCGYKAEQMHSYAVNLFSAQYMPEVCRISRPQKYTNINPCDLVTSAIEIVARKSYENCDPDFFEKFMRALNMKSAETIWDVVESPYRYIQADHLCPAMENPEAGTAVILIDYLLGAKEADKFIQYLDHKCEEAK